MYVYILKFFFWPRKLWTNQNGSSAQCRVATHQRRSRSSCSTDPAPCSARCRRRAAWPPCRASRCPWCWCPWCSSWGRRAAGWPAWRWAAGRWCDPAAGRSPCRSRRAAWRAAAAPGSSPSWSPRRTCRAAPVSHWQQQVAVTTQTPRSEVTCSAALTAVTPCFYSFYTNIHWCILLCILQIFINCVFEGNCSTNKILIWKNILTCFYFEVC